MKIRCGFVSNSSSSSFVISKGKASIDSIAKFMIGTMDSWNKRKRDKWIRNLEKRPDKTLGITFPSCNYDTYITEDEKFFYISTCWNEPFYFDMDDEFNTIRSNEDEVMEKQVGKRCFSLDSKKTVEAFSDETDD